MSSSIEMNKQQKSTTQRPPNKTISRSFSTDSIQITSHSKPTSKSTSTKLMSSHIEEAAPKIEVSTSKIDKNQQDASGVSNVSPRPFMHEDFELPLEHTNFQYQHQPNQHPLHIEAVYNDELSELIPHDMISQQYSPIHELPTMVSDTNNNEYGKDLSSRNLKSEESSRADERRNATSHRNDQMYNNIVNITGSLEYDEYDIERISTVIDNHTANMKKSIMDDLLTMKRALYQKHNDILNQQKYIVRADLRQAQSEIGQLKIAQQHLERELYKQYTTIEKMIRGRATHLHLIHYKPLMFEIFSRWFAHTKNNKRLNKLAVQSKKLHQKHLMKKIFQAWHKITRIEKRKAVDIFWQDKLEKVSANIIDKYEAELAQLRDTLEQAHSEINIYQEERDRYQQEMKKAFMRGVCALNLEAMSMFKKPQGAPVGVGGVGDIHDTSTVAAMQQGQGSYQPYAPAFPQSSFRPPTQSQHPPISMQRPPAESLQTPAMKPSVVRHPPDPTPSAQKQRVTFSVPSQAVPSSKKPPVRP